MIRVYKAKRLLVYTDTDGKAVFSCPISLGSSPVGRKEREGDGRTPEGEYYICSVNHNSKYHISLGISYPGPADAKGRVNPFIYLIIKLCHALRLRPPWHTSLGGFVMLHGEHPDKITGDWTAGCIALANSDIEYLADHCRKKEAIHIFE